mgnify:CR=1 FL=1
MKTITFILKQNKQKGCMKNRFLMLMLAVLLAFCSLSAWAVDEECEDCNETNTCPELDPSENMPIELGE